LQSIKADKNINTLWMENLPGGSWEDDEVLHNYMKEKLKEDNNEQKDHRCKATDQEAKYGVDDRDSSYGQTGFLF